MEGRGLQWSRKAKRELRGLLKGRELERSAARCPGGGEGVRMLAHAGRNRGGWDS